METFHSPTEIITDKQQDNEILSENNHSKYQSNNNSNIISNTNSNLDNELIKNENNNSNNNTVTDTDISSNVNTSTALDSNVDLDLFITSSPSFSFDLSPKDTTFALITPTPNNTANHHDDLTQMEPSITLDMILAESTTPPPTTTTTTTITNTNTTNNDLPVTTKPEPTTTTTIDNVSPIEILSQDTNVKQDQQSPNNNLPDINITDIDANPIANSINTTSTTNTTSSSNISTTNTILNNKSTSPESAKTKPNTEIIDLDDYEVSDAWKSAAVTEEESDEDYDLFGDSYDTDPDSSDRDDYIPNRPPSYSHFNNIPPQPNQFIPFPNRFTLKSSPLMPRFQQAYANSTTINNTNTNNASTTTTTTPTNAVTVATTSPTNSVTVTTSNNSNDVVDLTDDLPDPTPVAPPQIMIPTLTQAARQQLFLNQPLRQQSVNGQPNNIPIYIVINNNNNGNTNNNGANNDDDVLFTGVNNRGFLHSHHGLHTIHSHHQHHRPPPVRPYAPFVPLQQPQLRSNNPRSFINSQEFKDILNERSDDDEDDEDEEDDEEEENNKNKENNGNGGNEAEANVTDGGVKNKKEANKNDKKPKKKMRPQCPICFDKFDTMVSTKCGHVFCKKCIESALKRKKLCPICSTKLSGSKPFHQIFLDI